MGDLLRSIQARGLNRRRPVAIWCIDRPDAVLFLLSHPTLGPHLRDEYDSQPWDARLPVREWRTIEPDLAGNMRWMNVMAPGVYVEMSSGLPVKVKL